MCSHLIRDKSLVTHVLNVSVHALIVSQVRCTGGCGTLILIAVCHCTQQLETHMYMHGQVYTHTKEESLNADTNKA